MRGKWRVASGEWRAKTLRLVTAAMLSSGLFVATARGQMTGAVASSATVTARPNAPVVSLSPSSLNFGNQQTGTTSAAQTVTLTNTGGATLTISSISVTGVFGQTNGCGATLAPLGSCNISVTFSPAATGAASGTLSVSDNASGSPHTASLSGTGVAGSGVPATAGWYSIPNTAWASLCPNATGTRPDVQGGSGCGAVVDAWAGGYLDTKRHRLCWTGGGHHDYYGNEIYCLNLDTLAVATQNVASDASTLNTNTTSYDAMPDGTPGPRHTYGGLAYYPDIDSAIFMGGGPPNPGGTVTTTWAIDQSKLNPAATMGGRTVRRPKPGPRSRPSRGPAPAGSVTVRRRPIGASPRGRRARQPIGPNRCRGASAPGHDPGGAGLERTGRPDRRARPRHPAADWADGGAPVGDPAAARRAGTAMPAGPACPGGGVGVAGPPELSGRPRPGPELGAGAPGVARTRRPEGPDPATRRGAAGGRSHEGLAAP